MALHGGIRSARSRRAGGRRIAAPTRVPSRPPARRGRALRLRPAPRRPRRGRAVRAAHVPSRAATRRVARPAVRRAAARARQRERPRRGGRGAPDRGSPPRAHPMLGRAAPQREPAAAPVEPEPQAQLVQPQPASGEPSPRHALPVIGDQRPRRRPVAAGGEFDGGRWQFVGEHGGASSRARDDNEPRCGDQGRGGPGPLPGSATMRVHARHHYSPRRTRSGSTRRSGCATCARTSATCASARRSASSRSASAPSTSPKRCSPSHRIVGLGVYIWNAPHALQLVRTLKQVAPACASCSAGPRSATRPSNRNSARSPTWSRGEADLAFRDVCRALLAGEPVPRIVDAKLPHFAELAWPHDDSTTSATSRTASSTSSSRGCPFTCEFCLSALDIPVRKADTDVPRTDGTPARARRAALQVRGPHLQPRHRGRDRDPAVLPRALGRGPVRLHFELIPDRLPTNCARRSRRFRRARCNSRWACRRSTTPPANASAAARTSADARQPAVAAPRDFAHARGPDRWACPANETTFARGFDALWAMGPHEIQVGILKRLRGTPIVRHDDAHGMVCGPKRHAKCWRRRPCRSRRCEAMKPVRALLGRRRQQRQLERTATAPVGGAVGVTHAFRAFARWLHATTRVTNGIALHQLAGAGVAMARARTRRRTGGGRCCDGERLRALRASRLARSSCGHACGGRTGRTPPPRHASAEQRQTRHRGA